MVDRGDAQAALRFGLARVLGSPAWSAADSDDARLELLAAAVSDSLRPFSPAFAPGGAALGLAYERALRDWRIRAAFDGRNHDQLARRHGLTVRQVRRIVHRRRK